MLGMPPLYKRGTDCMNFGFDNDQPKGKVVRGAGCEYFYHKVHGDGVK